MSQKTALTPEDYGNFVISSERIGKYIDVEPQAELIMGVGPCRSGSKAQLYLMGASGYPAFDQPIKAIHRSLRLDDEPEPVTFSAGITYFKETWGPYTEGECRLDPLEYLSEVVSLDWLRNHLKIVFLPRYPEDTWVSWRSVWSDRLPAEILFHHFCMTYQTMATTYDQYRDMGFSIEIFPYEANQRPEQSYLELFKKLNVAEKPVVEGWNRSDIHQKIKKYVREFYEPELFLPEGIRDDVKQAEGIFFSDHDPETIDREIPQEIYDGYENLREKSPF